ncbi:MAG TPA: hypothetical protein VGJ20_03345 [Xanthobacteraceae bacterium]|jgi:hypothetical protein
MSESIDPPLKSASTPRAACRGHALAQVEKWMEIIREISREQQGQAKIYAEPGALEPTTE